MRAAGGVRLLFGQSDGMTQQSQADIGSAPLSNVKSTEERLNDPPYPQPSNSSPASKSSSLDNETCASEADVASHSSASGAPHHVAGEIRRPSQATSDDNAQSSADPSHAPSEDRRQNVEFDGQEHDTPDSSTPRILSPLSPSLERFPAAATSLSSSLPCSPALVPAKIKGTDIKKATREEALSKDSLGRQRWPSSGSSRSTIVDGLLATPKTSTLPRRASAQEGDEPTNGRRLERAIDEHRSVSSVTERQVPNARHATGIQANTSTLPATLELIGSSVTMPSNAKEDSIVKSRQGSVLTRGLVLKTDFFAGMRRPNLGMLLQGAPNFRQADVPGLQVYGVAQPTISGLKTILSVLQCGPLQEGLARDNVRGRQESLGRESSDRASSSSPARTELRSRPVHDADINAKKPHFPAPLSKRRCVWACTRNEPVVYVSGRPFVLREAERPLENFQLSGRATNLESIEHRLKADIFRESARYGGLLMVHEEDETGGLRPAWIAVDAEEVKTVREVWDDIRKAGWRCDYHRIPIAEDQPMENNYLDAYTQVIKEIDPINTAFVANCGLGVRRTSFAMVAAVLVRRKQMMLLGYPDPFQNQHRKSKSITEKRTAGARPSGAVNGVAHSMRVASEQQSQAQSTLEVVKTLSASLQSVGGQQSAVEVLLYQPLLLSALRSAKNGDYGVIGQLVGLLDHGDANKEAVDLAIDACSQVINLRHLILESRVRYAVAPPGQEKGEHSGLDTARASLRQAVQALEQYYFLITFASYVEGSETAIFEHRFATWLRSRAEIWHAISKIRSKGEKLYFFDPIADLSALSRRATNQDARGGSSIVRRNDTDPHLVPGDEFADHVVRNRSGLVLRPHTLLKEDIWRSLNLANTAENVHVRGAVNFRQISGTRIFATGQPTVDGIRNILRYVGDKYSLASAAPLQVTYINLREEPICHVNGKPYCLRQKGMSLRNIKSYSGISWNRLTLLEDRLKNDVLSELHQGDGCLLLHTETEEGGVVPVWEEANADDIDTLQDVMKKIEGELDVASIERSKGQDAALPNVHLIYRRLPITAEKPPGFDDLATIVRAVLRADLQPNACVVLNCQLGRGRSTLVSIVALLVSGWLKRFQQGSKNQDSKELPSSSPASPHLQSRPLSYHLINSLLRVIPRGLEVKHMVDAAIDQCDQVVNVRDAVEDARIAAESIDDDEAKRSKIQSGIYSLRRYFQLIVFQAYLDATPPSHVDSMPSFEHFVRKQPVFSTFWSESEKIDISIITPLQKVDQDGTALDDEVQEVVSNRAGNVLSTYTMLKSDMFPGLAAQALSQIEGIPNLRGESIILGSKAPTTPGTPWSSVSSRGTLQFDGVNTWGHGMPSIMGLRLGLEKIGGGPNGSLDIVATSLREEAVCVVNGRPHVLRLADQPFTNVETTGITTEAVERMEEDLKRDVIQELRKYSGRILLHDEKVNETTGNFDLFPVWESVREEDVLTPKEMYQMVVSEGYRVQYARVAVTDEQAPIPAVFHEMEERVLRALRLGAACVWNCQMGRGRTTTGMIIAALVSTIALRGEEIFAGDTSLNDSFLSGSLSSFLNNSADTTNTSTSESMDNREDELLLRGEYRTVLQLVAILKHGKLAKRLTDTAIDRMDAVQNLRKAIYDSKLRATNADASSSRRAHLLRVYRNYLERYGYLIVFANYLLEKAHAMVDAGMSTRHFGGDLSMPSADSPSDDVASDADSHADEDTSADDGEAPLSSSITSTSAHSHMSHDTAASLFVRDEGRRIFPNFINWLQPRREIHSILGRDRLE